MTAQTGTRALDVSLPTSCPAWCTSSVEGHRRAYDEIGEEDPAAASLHISGDVYRYIEDVVAPTTHEVLRSGGQHWEIQIEAAHAENWHGHPFIVLGLGKRADDVQLRLTSAEARVLARQLSHFADQIDLEGV